MPRDEKPAPGAPDPGYDTEKTPPPRVDVKQPQYPADFASRLKGKPGNINAQSQMEKSKRYE